MMRIGDRSLQPDLGTVASGALLLLGVALYVWNVRTPDTKWVAFVATTPWVLVLARARWRYRVIVIAFGIAFYVLSLGATPWLRSFSVVGWLVAPLFYLPFFVLAPVLTAYLLRRYPRVPLVVLWPLCFTSAEWLRIRTSIGELPLAQLGAGLISHSTIVQLADLTGAEGLTLLACITAACAAALLDALLTVRAHLPHRHMLRLEVGVALLAVALAFGYGSLRNAQVRFRRGPAVLVVQNDFHGWLNLADADRQQAGLFDLTLAASGGGRRPDLIAWPENSVIRVERGDPRLGRVESLARRLRSVILIDGPTPPSPTGVHHTAALVSAGEDWRRYDKVALVPWSEYLPVAPLLGRVSPAAGRAFTRFVRFANPLLIEMSPGKSVHPMALRAADGRSYLLATPICYEALSPRLMAAYFRVGTAGYSGAFVVNPVSERLLGGAIHVQTLALIRLRAIESRVTIVRASNNGISAAIDPSGRVYAWAAGPDGGYAVDRPATFRADVLLDARFGTVYSRWGDWLPMGAVLVLLAMIAPLRRGRDAVTGVGKEPRFPGRGS